MLQWVCMHKPPSTSSHLTVGSQDKNVNRSILFFYDSIHIQLRDRIFMFRWIRINGWKSLNPCHRKCAPLCYHSFCREVCMAHVAGSGCSRLVNQSPWPLLMGNNCYTTVCPVLPHFPCFSCQTTLLACSLGVLLILPSSARHPPALPLG